MTLILHISNYEIYVVLTQTIYLIIMLIFMRTSCF